VHVPALKPKPLKAGEALRAIDQLPDWAQPAFAGMTSLNRVQSAVADAALYSGENMLICAPTGECPGGGGGRGRGSFMARL
jgi:pre-mRNA-splicing helicase BRR2